MRGAFISDGESPTASAGSSPPPVAAVSDGARAGNDNDTRASIEGSFERDLHIPNNVDGRRQYFGEKSAYTLGQLRPRGAGTSHARIRHLRRCDAGGGTRLAYRLLQRLAGLRFSHANHIARARRCFRQQLQFIADRTRGLGTAAVDAEKVGHRIIFSTEQLVVAVHFPKPVGDYRVSLAQNWDCSDN
jgi:hypothetical protein